MNKPIKLTKTDMVIVKELRKKTSMQTNDFVAATNFSVRTIRNSLKKLKKIKIVLTSKM